MKTLEVKALRPIIGDKNFSLDEKMKMIEAAFERELNRRKKVTSKELAAPVGSGRNIWLVEDCDGRSILSAYATEKEAEKEREKLRQRYAPSVDFKVYSVAISYLPPITEKQ